MGPRWRPDTVRGSGSGGARPAEGDHPACRARNDRKPGTPPARSPDGTPEAPEGTVGSPQIEDLVPGSGERDRHRQALPTAAETAIRRRPNNARSPIRRKPPASPLPRPVDSRPRAEFAPAAAPDLPAVESRLEEDQRPNGGQTAVTSRGNARVVTLSSTQRRAPYRRLVPASGARRHRTDYGPSP
jgi:hypothetical protein